MLYGTLEDVLAKLQKGRNDVSGDDIYINCMEYQTEFAEKKIWEAHQVYYDIHYVLEGEECVQLASRQSMIGQGVYDIPGDYQLFDGAPQEEVALKKGVILICDSQDVHKVGIAKKKSEDVKKMVMKVRR